MRRGDMELEVQAMSMFVKKGMGVKVGDGDEGVVKGKRWGGYREH